MEQIFDQAQLLFISSVLVLLTVYLMNKAYQYYKINWPERYFGVEDKINIFISINPIYYFIFRLAPVIIAIFLTHGFFYASGWKIYNPIILGTLTGFIYSIVNDGTALLDLINGRLGIERFINVTSQYFLHFITIFLLTLSGTLAGLLATYTQLHIILPKFEGLIDNIWASFITVLLYFIIKSLINRPESIDVDELIIKSAKSISRQTELIKCIEETSKINSADEILVKAVCISENIQRPKWLRNIENIFGFFKPSGTYGIMQVHSKKPISDIKSIEIAIDTYFKDSANVVFSEKQKLIAQYNPNEKYCLLVEEVYRHISSGV